MPTTGGSDSVSKWLASNLPFDARQASAIAAGVAGWRLNELALDASSTIVEQNAPSQIVPGILETAGIQGCTSLFSFLN